MSFDIFLACLRSGKEEPIPRDLFESIFLPHATHPEPYKKDPGYMTVEHPDSGGACIYCSYDEEDRTHWSHMMFNHFGGDAFYADMYNLAPLTRSIIFWPTNKPLYLYTDLSVPAELKGIEYFEEARGVLILSGAEIEEAIASS